MAAPTIVAVYPSNNSENIPIGADIQITFDVGIDLSSGKANLVIYGPASDLTSGPDNAIWLDKGKNRFFLRSPDFGGIVECKYKTEYLTAAGAVVDPQPTLLSREQEVAGTYKHRLVVSPKQLLSANTEYSVYVIGDSEDGTSKGVSSRTIFDIDTTAVTSATAVAVVHGGYTGIAADTVKVKVTKAGDIGAAQYKWWYDSAAENSAVQGKVTSRRFRKVDDGIQIRFKGSAFAVDDIYTFKVYPPTYMATSSHLSFTSGSGSIEEVPASASTSVIGELDDLVSSETRLEVVEMSPSDGATHQSIKTRKIEITFSENLDVATVTDDNVTVLSYPVSGHFDGPSGTRSDEPEELYKKLTVADNVLTVEI